MTTSDQVTGFKPEDFEPGEDVTHLFEPAPEGEQAVERRTCDAEVEAADGNGQWRQVSYGNMQHLEPSGMEPCGALIVEGPTCGSCGVRRADLDPKLLTDAGGHIVWGAVPDHCGPFGSWCTADPPHEAPQP